MNTLQRAIAKYRSQRAAAEAWGLSPQYVCDMLQGRRNVSVNAAIAIETATGISARKLLREQSDKELEAARNRLQPSASARI